MNQWLFSRVFDALLLDRRRDGSGPTVFRVHGSCDFCPIPLARGESAAKVPVSRAAFRDSITLTWIFRPALAASQSRGERGLVAGNIAKRISL